MIESMVDMVVMVLHGPGDYLKTVNWPPESARQTGALGFVRKGNRKREICGQLRYACARYARANYMCKHDGMFHQRSPGPSARDSSPQPELAYVA